jgi:NADP-dependent 3-hydroxy acid dehydrogenase YdfG
MSDVSLPSLEQLRAEWRERLRAARDRAHDQIEDMGIADLRALRATIREEMATLEERLPNPGPIQVKGPMTAEEQAEHVQHALQYNALEVREQVVSHELRRRALGPEAVDEEVTVPARTQQYATLAWTVMAEGDAQTPEAVYRDVAHRAEEDVYLSTVEKWLRQENPHHPEQSEGSWSELRRAVLLASS